MKLSGKFALVTGGSRGLGKSIVKAFVAEGASVMFCARDEKQLQAAQSELMGQRRNGQKIEARVADVSNPQQTQELIEAALKEFPHLDILVNNAGIYGPKGYLEENDWEEWVQAIRINLLGTVFPCRGVLRHFKKRNTGKIINVSGGGSTHPLFRFTAYSTSKAAVVRFTETLAEELKGYRIDVNALAPGALNTRLLEEVLSAGPGRVGEAMYEKAKKQKLGGGASLEKASSLCVFLASSESDGITGKLISAAWDPWESLPQHLEELRETDIYTLRRILPLDRGRTWGGLIE